MKPYFLTFLMALIIALANLLGRGGRQTNSLLPACAEAVARIPRPRSMRKLSFIKSIKELAHGN
jgi:hypothetical protein